MTFKNLFTNIQRKKEHRQYLKKLEFFKENEDKVWEELKFYRFNKRTNSFVEISKDEVDWLDFAIVKSNNYKEYRYLLGEHFSQLEEVNVLYFKDCSHSLNGYDGTKDGWKTTSVTKAEREKFVQQFGENY